MFMEMAHTEFEENSATFLKPIMFHKILHNCDMFIHEYIFTLLCYKYMYFSQQ